MNKEKDDTKQFNAEDIRRYLAGTMTPAERHALEKAALDDPFLAEAIEGHADVSDEKAASDLRELRDRLQQRLGERKKPVFKWLKIAAAIAILLTGITITSILINRPAPNREIAKAEVSQPDTIKRSQSSVDSAKTGSQVQSTSTDTAKKDLAIADAKQKTKDKPATLSKKNAEDRSSASVQSEDAKNNNLEAVTEPAAPEVALNQKSNEGAKKEQPAFVRAEKNYKADSNLRFNYFRGQVLNPDLKPVPFANISIANTNSNTYADARGVFNLLSADSLLNIEVKSVGFVNQSSFIQSEVNNNRIILKPTTESLSEVAVNAKRAKSKPQPSAAAKTTEDKSEVEETLPQASPVDGWDKYDLYLLNNKHLSNEMMKNDARGSVTVSFLVDEKGKLSDFRIEKTLCTACDKEAIRLIKEGPHWQNESGAKSLRTHVTVVF